MLRIVHVRWRDSQFHFDQQKRESAANSAVAVFESVGHLVHEDEDRVVIAGDYDPGGEDVRQVLAIPRENVLKVRTLK